MSAPLILPIDVPLDLPSTLASGQCFRWRVDELNRWTGVIDNDIVRLWMEDSNLHIESAPTPGAEIAEAIVAYLRLDDDLPSIQRSLCEDERVRVGIANYPGLRLLRQDPWETLAGFILSSTSNIPRISKTMELLANTFGEPREMDGICRNTFASPEAIADAGEADLRALGCGFRAPYLSAAAEAVVQGRLPIRSLRGSPYADVLAELTALYGVGEKIADCVMLFSLDRLEAFPADRWVRKVLADWYGVPSNISYDGARQFAWERFGANAGYANQYLFWNERQSTRPMRISQ